uniref:Uncharacterized protein n=1 Tax=Macrostomum lignano TaxID=282301 RepID=A0A1I8FAT0_9PLAT
AETQEALRSLEELDACTSKSRVRFWTSACSSYSTPETRDGQAAMSTSVANSSAEISTSFMTCCPSRRRQQAQTQVCPVAT